MTEFLPLRVDGGDLVGDEVADARPERVVVFGEDGALHAGSSLEAAAVRWPMISWVTEAERSTLSRCAPGSTTVRDAPGMAAAMTSACATGVAGSCAPAITRVGAVTAPRLPIRSIVAMASQ